MRRVTASVLFLFCSLAGAAPSAAQVPVWVELRYVDGAFEASEARNWPRLRAEAVDEVKICAAREPRKPRCTALSGQSIYWVYREGDAWVMGGGGVGPEYFAQGGELPAEVLVTSSGEHRARRIRFMPDLRLRDVKLGWWWPEKRAESSR